MIKLAFIFSSLLATITTNITNCSWVSNEAECEIVFLEDDLFQSIFQDLDKDPKEIDWSDIELLEIEEEADLGFDTKAYLPAGFNPYKGMRNLDWSKIELVELEEEVELGFDTKDYLPAGFNPLQGKHDLDWNHIKLMEVDEEVTLGFNSRAYLPADFDPYIGMCAP